MKINRGKQQLPRKTVIYGGPGIGKSTIASQCPDAIFLPTEDGLGQIDCHSFDIAASYDDVMSNIGQLYTEDHSYKAVVIDSADWLERLIWESICQQQSVESIEQASGSYGKGYVLACNLFSAVLTGLDALRQTKGMHIIIIAHAKTESHKDPENPDYDRWVPKLHKHVSALLLEWADEMLFAHLKVLTTTEDGGFGRKTTKALDGGKRVLRTVARPTAVAKNRLNLPDEIDFNWAAYAQHFTPKTVAPSAKKES